MKVLHTSDWHIGRTLYGRKSYEEFKVFLAWPSEAFQKKPVDALLVAGNIINANAPRNRVQELYYSYSRRLVNIVVEGKS